MSRKFLWLCLMGSLGLTGFNALFYMLLEYNSNKLRDHSRHMPAIILVGSVIIFKEAVNITKVIGNGNSIFGVLVVVSQGDYERVVSLSFNYGDMVMLCMFFLLWLYPRTEKQTSN